MRALIVGKDGIHARNVLSATRGMGAAHWDVGIGAPTPGLAAHSRWSSRWHYVPSPTDDFGGFVDAINRAIDGFGYAVVFAGGDAEVLALSAASDRIKCRVPYPPFETTVRALDKLTLAAAAVKCGISVPRTRLATPNALAEIDGEVLVKARLHWQPGTQNVPDRLNAVRVSGRAAAEARVRQIIAAGGEAVLQDLVEGRHTAYVALLGAGHQVIVAHQQDGYGTWPQPEGVWTRAETVPLQGDLHERCAKLLGDLGWVGLVQLQFLVAADEEPQLIDLNGRFYASLGLAIRAGVNLPALWADMAVGRRPIAGSVLPGIRYQWLEGDLRRAIKERRGGIVADLVDTVRYSRGAVPSLWRWSDPKPALAWLVLATRRLVGGVGPRRTLHPLRRARHL